MADARGRLVRRRLALCVLVAAAGLGSAVPAVAGVDPSPAVAPRPLSIGVERGRLTVDVQDADLGQVLHEIATRAGFRLTTTGWLGRVTASLAGVSLEEGLQRLAQGCELVLVYQAAEGHRADQRLIDVSVFAASPAYDPARVAAAQAEIAQLIRAGPNPAAVARLVDLLGTAPDSSVRVRAAWALGRTGGPTAESALTAALTDQSADVRVQVLHALQLVGGVRAIPAFEGLLLHDPDAGVRLAAARALGVFQAASAVSALRSAANDRDPAVRREVSEALRRQSVAAPR